MTRRNPNERPTDLFLGVDCRFDFVLFHSSSSFDFFRGDVGDTGGDENSIPFFVDVGVSGGAVVRFFSSSSFLVGCPLAFVLFFSSSSFIPPAFAFFLSSSSFPFILFLSSSFPPLLIVVVPVDFLFHSSPFPSRRFGVGGVVIALVEREEGEEGEERVKGDSTSP